MSLPTSYQQASTKTANDLRTVAHSQEIRALSRLSLPEIDAVVDLTAQIVPAGNVPGMILSGLARIPAQRLPVHTMHQHINILFKGVEQILDRAAYGAFFAGPAAVIWGYQNLLKLAGKDPESSFPEGAWQFYVDYALREDTARHITETHGFDTLLEQHDIYLSEQDRITAWVMAAVSSLHQYEALLEIEWRERVATKLLRELTTSRPDAARYARLYREWEIQRPYRRDAEAARYDYPEYRHLKFDQFLAEPLRALPEGLHAEWRSRLEKAAASDLPAYQRQMSILSYLDPGPYGEARTSFHISDAQVGLVYRGEYHLMPVCAPGTSNLLDAETAREQVAALLAREPGTPANLMPFARMRRAAWPVLRRKLSPALLSNLQALNFAPILLNFDSRSQRLSLTDLRQAERGVGSHALTVFQTGKTFVFDQSHIFFDGILGAALAEILTNEALSWAVYLSTLPEVRPAAQAVFTTLNLSPAASDLDLCTKQPRVTVESGVETERILLKPCATLRRLFKQRNSQLQLTVNDLLVLYRAIHAAHYQPSAGLVSELESFASQGREQRALADSLRKNLDDSCAVNPSMLIPMDASRHSPRERLYPLCIEIPLAELDLLGLHQRVLQALRDYENTSGDRAQAYAEFDQLQRTYLASLAGFGIILNKWKEIAVQGQSASVGAIKMLAHMPVPLQRLLDKVPERFEVLNNLLKGREVFSNVGAVIPTSTLTRFVTAKDDNEQKQLAWGILTDARGFMRISLRDFRPHVAALHTFGRSDLARQVAQNYLDSYADGFNAYIRDLQRITIASRRTRFIKRASP
ncbi:MAG: hypothetical protein CVU44_10685 [Chloroflexi bacterium HGW-Chloroflexi-6]|nr:MAG: hypothetical protein CVU44_10685 [Chloroflexi bacterium HGW-Chloroflexi-6]